MKSPNVPPAIQAVGLACVPVADMPRGTALARMPVAAAIVTVTERGDGHRDALVTTVSDARDMEHPLPVLINDALIEGVPTVITQSDYEVLAIEAASRRFFCEPALGALASGQNLIDPVGLFGRGHDEAALCRRLSTPTNLAPDSDIARWWNRDAPQAVEDVAVTIAVSRLVLWAHAIAYRSGRPDGFFETMIPLRLRLLEMEDERPTLKAITSSRPFHRAASFASSYREYRARGDSSESGRWLTFEDGQSYV